MVWTEHEYYVNVYKIHVQTEKIRYKTLSTGQEYSFITWFEQNVFLNKVSTFLNSSSKVAKVVIYWIKLTQDISLRWLAHFFTDIWKKKKTELLS